MLPPETDTPCGAINQDATRCHATANVHRNNTPVCGTHSRLFDEYADLIGENGATIRIREGRQALGDVNALAHAHSMRVLTSIMDDSGLAYSVPA